MTITDATTDGDPSGGAAAGDVRFEPPGPGQWMLDTTHHGRRPTTRFMRGVADRDDRDGFASLVRRFGLPLETMRFESVNGYMYARPKAVGEPDRPGKPPPAAVMWLVARLHPELRRRNRTAKRAWEQRLWRQDVIDWFDRGGRDHVVAANLRFQRFDVVGADGGALADHLSALEEHLAEQFVLGFETHGGDIIPCGDFLAHCDDWGIPSTDATALLAGASPATVETRELLAPVAAAVAARDHPPATVEEVRAASTEAAAAIDRWLELHGWRLLNSDDVDCPTLVECPDVQRRILLGLGDHAPVPSPDPGPVRELVPEPDRDRFDELLAEARYGLRLRDDNVGIRLNWPAGLARRALLEIGRRLAGRGRIAHESQTIHCTAAELSEMLRGDGGPSPAEVADRVAEHERQLMLDPPSHLGPDEPPPPVHLFPAPMRRATRAVLALVDAMQGDTPVAGADPDGGGRTGFGVGDDTYTGRACVISGPDDDFGAIEAGDVLIAPFTSPSFNSVFPLLGAVAVEEGGPMSHTAIVSREFGIPAVVGVEGLVGAIRTGDVVTVDAATGTVVVAQGD